MTQVFQDVAMQLLESTVKTTPSTDVVTMLLLSMEGQVFM